MKTAVEQGMSKVPEVTLLFWIIRIAAATTVGTTLADFADRSLGIGYAGGLALTRYTASAALLVFIVACILLFPQRAASRSH